MSKHDDECLRRREQEGMALVCSCGMTGDQVVAARRSLPDRSTREAAKAAWAYLAALGAAYDPESMLVDAPGIWEQHLDAYEEMLQTIGFEHLRAENERMHQMLKTSEEHTQHHEAEAERLREAIDQHRSKILYGHLGSEEPDVDEALWAVLKSPLPVDETEAHRG